MSPSNLLHLDHKGHKKLIYVDTDKAYRHKNRGLCLLLYPFEGMLEQASKPCSSGVILVYRLIASCCVFEP